MQKIRWEKNLVSYLFWLWFCAVTAVTFGTCILQMLTELGVADIRAKAGIICVLLIGELRLFLMVEKRCISESDEQSEENKMSNKGIYFFALCIACLSTIVSHIVAFLFLGKLSETSVGFYQLAMVQEQSTSMLQAASLSYETIYLHILHQVLFFTGNHMTAACLLQIVLQICMIWFMHLVAKEYFGKVAGIVALLLGAIYPPFLLGVNLIQPDVLLCIHMLLVLHLTALLMKRMNQMNGVLLILGFGVIGLLLGIGMAFHLIGAFVFLALWIGLITFCGTKKNWKSWIGILLFTMTTVGAFVIVSHIQKRMAGNILAFVFSFRSLPEKNLQALLSFGITNSGSASLMGVFLCCIMTGMSVIGFWRIKKEGSLIWGSLLCLTLIAAWQNTPVMPYNNWTGVLWILCACLGIQYFIDKNEMHFESEDALNFETVDEPESENITSRQENAEKEIAFIPNPLPLPKKHIPKTLDYDVLPDEKQLEFDYQITEEKNDYDI